METGEKAARKKRCLRQLHELGFREAPWTRDDRFVSGVCSERTIKGCTPFSHEIDAHAAGLLAASPIAGVGVAARKFPQYVSAIFIFDLERLSETSVIALKELLLVASVAAGVEEQL